MAFALAAIVVALVTFATTAAIRDNADELAASNERARSISDAVAAIAGIDGLYWAGRADSLSRPDAIDPLEAEARASLDRARQAEHHTEGEVLIDTAQTQLATYANGVERDLRAIARGEPLRFMAEADPGALHDELTATLRQIQDHVDTDARATADDVHLATLWLSLVSVAAVIAVVTAFLALRQRAARRALTARADLRFRTLLSQAPDIVLIVEPSGRVVFQTPSYARKLGYEPGELDGTMAIRLVAPHDKARVLHACASLPPGDAITIEYDVVTKDGQTRNVEAHIANRSHDPHIGGLVVNAHDVTEQHRLEAQLRQSAKLEAVGQLAGGVAHDFNNILAAIHSYVDLIDDVVEDDEVRADLAEIRTAAQRGAALARQILTFSRMDVETAVVVDLNEQVRSVERLLERTIGDTVDLRIAVCDAPTRVVADPVGLEQVLINLAVNARDAMETGGALTIATEHVALDPTADDDDLRPTGRCVRLSVTDTGVGMTPEVVERVFEPFFTTKDTGKGTGLGLATVYGVVRRAGGRIDVRSEPGRGTRIEILLPLVEEEPTSGASGARSDAQRTDHLAPRSPVDDDEPRPERQPAILLVEDERPVRLAVERILTSAGYPVHACVDGADAIATAERVEFDLLLTDVVMPGGVSGRDVAQRLRASRPELPVIYTSGYSADAVANRGVVEPGVPLLAKPVTRTALLDAVAQALRTPAASNHPH